jgi:hypothetical protein
MHHAYMIKIPYTPPIYAILLHWEKAQTYPFHLPINHSPYRFEKETWAICYEKERVGKDDEKRERWEKGVSSNKKRMNIKDSPWSQASRFGERIFKESTFHSYPHTCTLDHILYVVFLHGSMLWLYNTNILSMSFKFSYPKLHISYSCRALRQRKILVRTYTQIPLSDFRESYEE